MQAYTSKSICIIAILLVLCMITPSSLAWVGQISSRTTTPSSTPTSKTISFYRNDINDHQTEIEIDAFLSPTKLNTLSSSLSSSSSSSNKRARTMDLPKHSPPQAEMERTKLMLDMEMFVGRIAMISFLVFVAGEFTTGLSAPQQLLMMNTMSFFGQ